MYSFHKGFSNLWRVSNQAGTGMGALSPGSDLRLAIWASLMLKTRVIICWLCKRFHRLGIAAAQQWAVCRAQWVTVSCIHFCCGSVQKTLLLLSDSYSKYSWRVRKTGYLLSGVGILQPDVSPPLHALRCHLVRLQVLSETLHMSIRC